MSHVTLVKILIDVKSHIVHWLRHITNVIYVTDNIQNYLKKEYYIDYGTTCSMSHITYFLMKPV